MNWLDTFHRYVRAPFEAWPQDRPLQARKLADAMVLRSREQGVAPDALVERVAESAQRRAGRGLPTLFLVNCGSSGSHWVEAMLSSLPAVRACGEVYVPPIAGPGMRDTGDGAGAAFLDALHQMHAEPAHLPVGDDDILINSAHSWGPHDLAGPHARAVLLVRDPLDVVMSRTFRKPRLRRHLQPDASDREYLDTNIAMVDKFYRSAMRRKPAHVVRYEDVLANPGGELARIGEIVGLRATRGSLDEIGERFSARDQRRTDTRLSNLYMGPSPDQPHPLTADARERLGPVRDLLGYA